jgi:glyoxylase-like metal-dependent hydrolase (beta-lactamase superfamily II)
MALSRRSFLVTSSLAAASAFVRPPRLAAQAPQPAQAPPATSFRELRGGVGVFEGRGGTIGYLVTPDALVVVDAQYPDTAALCLEGLRQRSGRRIDALINTHHHGDHTAGNGVFREAAARIVAHARVPELQKQAAEQQGTAASQVYADTTFTDVWRLPVGKETVTARYYGPAHTSGDAVIHFEQANVVHIGDLIFNRRHPVIDRPAGASIRNWASILEQVAANHTPDTLYIFGHGREGFGITGTRADLFLQRDYFTALLEATRKAVAAGTPKEAFVKMEGLPGFPDHTPIGGRFTFAVVLGIAYDEVTQGG